MTDPMDRILKIARECVTSLGADLDDLLASQMPPKPEVGNIYTTDDGREIVFPVLDARAAQKNASLSENRAGKSNAEICFGERFASFRGAVPDTSTDPRLTEALKAFIRRFPETRGEGRGVVLCGPPSCGKTYLAAWVAEALSAAGWAGKMVSEEAFLRTARERRSLSSDLSHLTSRDFVVVDGLLGSRDPNGTLALVDALYSAGIPTIYTTVTWPRFFSDPSFSDAPIADRIAERCLILACPERNWRREMRAARTAVEIAGDDLEQYKAV